MGAINYTRVIIGGLAAGVVMNIGEYLLNELILGERWAAVMEGLGRPPVGGGQIAAFVVLTFLTAIALVWLYAAIRPRFGPGGETAIRAGLAGWVLLWLIPSGYYLAMGMFPPGLIYISLVWGFVEAPVATLLGAWLYQEGGEQATAPGGEAV